MTKQDRICILPSRWLGRSRVGNDGGIPDPDAQAMAAWRSLPDHLLFLVANAGLSAPDLLRLSQVCKPFASLSREPAAWDSALKMEMLPRDMKELLCKHHIEHPICAHLRTVSLFLRHQRPACLCAAASHGSCLLDPTAQYPKVLHLNGTTQRTIQADFPPLPAGRYLVCLRVRAAHGFNRGYIRFRTVFSKNNNSPAHKDSHQHLGQPQPAPYPQQLAAPGDDDVVADAEREQHAHRSIIRKRLPFLQRVQSHLLGRYISTWYLLERASMTHRLLPMTPKAIAANLGEGATFENSSASEASNQQQGDDGQGWGDVFVGHVVLYRQCQPAFTLAFIQIMGTPDQQPGGLYVDCVRMVPVNDLASYHN